MVVVVVSVTVSWMEITDMFITLQVFQMAQNIIYSCTTLNFCGIRIAARAFIYC